MELPNFIKKNKDKIIEIAKWSNKHYRESAIIQYLNNKTETLYSDESAHIAYPNKTTKNDLHIHPLPENKIGNNDKEIKEITFQYFISNAFKILPSYGDMNASSWNNSIGGYHSLHSKSKYMFNNNEKLFNNYIASLDNENNILYVMNYSTNLVDNRMHINAYKSLSKNIDDFETQLVEEYRDLYDKLHTQFLINDVKVSEYPNYMTNEMKNKEAVKELKKLIDNNFILYTIKL